MSENNQDSPFGQYEEEAIVSLILDFPELYVSIAKYLTAELFSRPEVQYVIASIRQDFENHGTVPTRRLLFDRLSKSLTVEDPYEDILGIVQRESNPREVPMLRRTLRQWAEYKIYDMLYTDEALVAHQRGDYQYLQKIFEDAERISSVGTPGFWLLDQVDELFVDNAIEHISTGFPKLDRFINDGGPSPGEVLIWLAPTNVGKSLMLSNNAVTAARNSHNVMIVTFELSKIMTGLRIAANISEHELNKISKSNINELSKHELQTLRNEQLSAKRKITDFKKYGSDIVIYELPPDECSVNDIFAIIDNNRKMRGWVPKVIILDYLELMVAKRQYDNERGDYVRQKSVSTEICGLAKRENVLIYSATQGNRASLESSSRQSENGPTHLGLDKAAESFGKAMPVDYVVSLNQRECEYRPKQGPSIIRLWIAKNRNGPKFESIETNVYYGSMRIKEPK